LQSSQAKKYPDYSDNKPFLLVERQGNGRPAFRLLTIEHLRFNNSGSQSNKINHPVHISKVITDALRVILSRVSGYYWGVD